MLGGIVAGAMGGLGQAMQADAEMRTKAELERQNFAAQADVTLARQKTLEQFKLHMANSERIAQTQRIQGRADQIADQAVAGKRATAEAGIVDRSSWTPEQQAAVDQSLANDKQALASDPDVRLRAAADTGDMSIKEVVTMERDEKKLAAAERAAARKEALDREKEDRKDAREIEREERRDARAREAEDRRDARLNRMLAAQAERAERLASGRPPAGYRWKGDGTLEAIPGGPASTGKALPTKMVSDLTEQATITDSTERFNSTFKPEYAGKTIAGDLSNTSKRIFGDDTGQAQWWQDYALHESTIRNKLFGASLTQAEQGQWLKLTVTPRMDAEQVRQNLARRAEIERRGLERLMLGAAKGGYSVDQIEAVTGRAMPGKKKDDAAPTSTAAPAPSPGSGGGASGGWSIREVK